MTTGTYLDKIIPRTKLDLDSRRSLVPESELINKIKDLPSPIDFYQAFRKDKLHLIAEIKRASPSKGILDENLDVEDLATLYINHGATAISVLTDSPFFRGSLEDLKTVTNVAHINHIPVLRKDFIVDQYQIYESRYWGADAILLIAVCLTNDEILEFQELANSLSIASLIEVHSEEEFFRVQELNPRLLGINNRDLKSFETDLSVTSGIAPRVGQNTIVVSESGINNSLDARNVRAAGADAILVGESLITSENRATLIEELSNINDPRNGLIEEQQNLISDLTDNLPDIREST